MDRVTTPLVDWALASRPLAHESGDACIVRTLPEGTLLGVVDGLGHGQAAAAVTRKAVRLLGDAQVRSPLEAIRICHQGLRATRGVVLTLAWVDGARDLLTWLGVGNIQGVLVHGAVPRQETLVGWGGVVGRHLPPLHPRTESIASGDLLILATDGIRPEFAHRIPRLEHPQQVADAILSEHRTGADDALVLVARYRGSA